MRAPTLTQRRARELRQTLTPPEARLWVRLRGRKGCKPVFRRQHPEGPFILDFCCTAARLAVEVDGEIHGFDDHPQRDARKDAWLRARGVHVLRIPARDVMAVPDGVADSILRLAMERIGGVWG